LGEAATLLQMPPEEVAPLTPFHQRLLAEELTSRSSDSTKRLAFALSEARVDLNPHQIEAAAFALDSLSRGGCMLADEVGLGKTIEAGIVISQLLAEGRTRILILAPATLRAQWQSELAEKFDTDAVVIDGRSVKNGQNPFDQPFPVICSIPFGANRAELLRTIEWDLVVIDEAHRLRNSHKPSNKTGKALRGALRDRPKLLLTATPLQNELGELFGLVSILDEQILGPEHAFKARYPVDAEIGALTDDASRELKERLAPFVQRTLRRQVKEYVRYTNRRSIVEDFAPSADEQTLYDSVSEYLRRAESSAIEPGKKTLLTLVYRKLLASSTYAIAPTLRKLAEGLRRRLQRAKLQAKADLILGDIQDQDPDEAGQYSEEAEEWSDDPAKPVTVRTLENECFELEQYANLADSIRVNAKGEALKRALDRTFGVARTHGWPEKAVVFTESRRTQEYLNRLLSENGYEGKISLLSGDAGTPEQRRELVETFRDKSQILISTEAGAEGLNLQFCNLVVNYDLPWNPQRVEQRIGRCHRYGQTRDVLVINFLNRQNAADARLYELLEKKLNLFDGVFGASDEILGALESGVDFEKRVLDIYQSCRSQEEINAAFDALRSDLEHRIDQRMTEARSLLLERFDGDVRRRLRIAGEQAKENVRRRRQGARALASSVLGAQTDATRSQVARAAGEVRGRGAPPVSYLRLDSSGLPARLAKLSGSEGWWFAYRFETTGLKPEERLVHLVFLKESGGFRLLPIADSEVFLKLAGQEETLRKPAAISVSAAHEQGLASAKDELLRAAERRNTLELDHARDRADRYAEDCLMQLREGLEDARNEWQEARKAVLAAEEGADRVRARALAERLEREYRRKLTALRAEEDARYGQKDRTTALLTQKAKVLERRTLVASAYFWLG
jgi:superfamily II DNA/RNA helicase